LTKINVEFNLYENAYKLLWIIKMPTMKDIAKYADVSLATVSRVLNGIGNVSTEKRKRVMEWVQKLEYTPNASARDLAGSRSYLLGVILPDISNPFFAEILCQMEEQAFLYGYSIMLSNTKGRKNKIREIINVYNARQVDGLLICIDPRESSLISNILNKGIPAVSFTQSIDQVDSVFVSMERGGALVAQHFLDLGHEKITFIGEKTDPKFIGFEKYLNENGVFVDDQNISAIDGWSDLSSETVLQKLRNFVFNMDEDVTAIFALNDITAIHVMQVLQERKIRIPEDIILAGYDNIFLSREIDPSLTSVAQPTKEIGRLSVEMLINRINNKQDDPTEKIILEPRLIVRQSTLKI